VFEAFRYAFVQRGVVEVLLLSVAAGLLGTWILLRGLAFYSHAVATAAFPGLVLADGLGFAAPLGAFGAAVVFAGLLAWLTRARREQPGAPTALALVGSIALGVILAADVFGSGSNVETLLFGSLLALDSGDLVLAATASAAALAATVVLGRRWLAAGFDPESAAGLGLRSAWPDAALLALLALVVVASLAAAGALLASALFVVPAATVRLWTRRVVPWQLASVALVAAEGVAGLWLSVETDVPPGAAIAVLAGGAFALAALARVAGPARILGVAAVLALSGCASAGSAGGRLEVVATTTQLADWARAVGGGDVDVHGILRSNTDPHEYEPRPSDVEATARAGVVLVNGAGLDDWMSTVVSEAGGDPAVVDLFDRIPIRSGRDPHWWHDPRNAEAAVRAIASAFARADPSHRADYRRNGARYLARLRALDARIAGCLSEIPAPERKLVTDHDAFGYFARRYGLRIVGAVIPAQTTQAQPSAGETAHLISLIRREHVGAVFPETSVNARLAEAVARETGARSDLALYGDTLGPVGSSGATYLGMEAANADAIANGLSGGRVRCPS
jgi:zinc/manganese transport system substrate-binding protein